MWILNGPFDGEVAGEMGFTKPKLLKTGKTYGMGRKGCPLIVNNKKISSKLAEFVVGKFGNDDVVDPTRRPRLEFVNKKDKPLKILRNEVISDLHPNAPCELQDGDSIAILHGVAIGIEWKEVCCYVETSGGKLPVSLEECANLGIHIVYDANRQTTHHICSKISSSPIFASSLLSLCDFAKMDWLNEVIRLGNTTLEDHFNLPLTSKYLPEYSESIPEKQRLERVWQPNEERHAMLSSYRFLCIDEKGRELDGGFREMIERGAGSFEIFDPHSGRAKFHKALARGQAKEGKKQIIVGKQLSIQAAVGKEVFQELLQEAKSYQLGLTTPEQIINAVIETDPSLLVGDLDVGFLQDNETPSGHPAGSSHKEPSVLPEDDQEESQPRRKLVRRATSRQPSVEPTPASGPVSGVDIPLPGIDSGEPEALPRPRRALTRRANAGPPVVTGLDDPSSIIDAVPELEPPRQKTPPPPPPITDLTAPTPGRPRKLKRRAAGGVPDVAASQALWGIEETPIESEPPLKKFKALFDASGQQTFDESAFDEVQTGNYSATSQTQSQTQSSGGQNGLAKSVRNLTTLREEEEEETQTPSAHPAGTKRPLDDIDENMETDDAPPSAQPSKRRAIENINAVDRSGRNTEAQGKPSSTVQSGGIATKPPSKGNKTGAEPGKPDQDHAFLKALASTRKGKKKEDEFDRDFNNLKISKPDLDRPNPADEWKLLADFGDDTNLRGNFMTIVELPAYNRNAIGTNRRTPDPTWNGLPNFKKFKKKDAPRSTPVQLFAPEANDYGIGAAYWESGTTQQGRSQQSSGEGLTKPMSQQSKRAASKTPAPAAFSDSEEELGMAKARKSTRASSRSAPTVPSKRTRARAIKSESTTPLFIQDSDDEDDDDKENDDNMDVDDDTSTLATNTVTKSRSQPSNTRTTGRGKKPVITVDDDSDDGVFKGFGSKSRRR